MGGGKSQQSKIDKISTKTRNQLRKLIQSQIKAEKQAGKAQAKDLQFQNQQLELQNKQSAAQQNLLSQQLTSQQNTAKQYSQGLQQQLALMQDQNKVLSQKNQSQTAYQNSLLAMQKKQFDMNLKQQKRAQDEANYTSALEQREASNAATQGSFLSKQLNRRRKLRTFGGR